MKAKSGPIFHSADPVLGGGTLQVSLLWGSLKTSELMLETSNVKSRKEQQ